MRTMWYHSNGMAFEWFYRCLHRQTRNSIQLTSAIQSRLHCGVCLSLLFTLCYVYDIGQLVILRQMNIVSGKTKRNNQSSTERISRNFFLCVYIFFLFCFVNWYRQHTTIVFLSINKIKFIVSASESRINLFRWIKLENCKNILQFCRLILKIICFGYGQNRSQEEKTIKFVACK